MIEQLKPYVTSELGENYLAGIKFLDRVITLRFSSHKDRYADLVSAGVEAILKYLKSYSPNTNCKFTTYIYRRLPQSLMRALNREDYFMSYPVHYRWKDQKHTFIPDFIVDKDGKETEFYLSDEGDEVCKMDFNAQLDGNKALVKRLLNRLMPRDRDIVELRYGFTGRQFSRKEIASIYGISEDMVRTRLQSSLKTMRKALNSINKRRQNL